jgi:putative membrane-bound dehydrogenase-like protein
MTRLATSFRLFFGFACLLSPVLAVAEGDALVVVAASSVQPGNDAWRACDGDPATRWCASGADLPAWLTIDLGRPHAVRGVRVEWEQAGTTYRHRIETSLDGNAWTVAVDATGNTAKGRDDHAFASVESRFVRIVCVGTTGGWASIREAAIVADGLGRIRPQLDEGQKKALAAEQAAAERARNDPYAKSGNAPPRVETLSPERERKILDDVKVPEGFDVTVFAAPPLVNYPVFVAAAPDGTLYVSSDGNGSLGREPGRGRVIRLRDTDGDDRADEAKVFCEVDAPRGLVWDHDRLYLVHPPHLSVFIDANGDGTADEQQILVRNIAFGYDKRPADHTTNGLSLGIDGWLYVAGGDFGFMDAEGADGRRLTHRGGGVIRVRPDGTGLEIHSTGTRNNLEVAISPTMDLFTRDNTNDGGGWNVRFHHFTGLDDHGYPRLYKNFADECVAPLADYGGGSGCGATYIDEPGFGEWNAAPFTADWGTGALWRHDVRPRGAGYEEVSPPRAFVRMTRPTDADVDATGRVYCASWKGATFNWEGADVGYIVCVKPRGFRAAALPDFATAAEPELAALLAADSTAGHRRRLAAQRELARRGSLQADAWLRAMPARRPAERNLVDRFVQVVAARDRAAVGEILPHVGSADPVVAHTAIRAVAALGDASATLAALDRAATEADRRGLLRSLAMMHATDVVTGLLSRLDATADPSIRRDLLAAVCRLHFREGVWKGDSWGTRPDTRGPYYQPEAWEETPRIAAALSAALAAAAPVEAAALVREMGSNRIGSDAAIERIVALADRDPALVADAVVQLANLDAVPTVAIPLLSRAIADPAASGETVALAVTALAKSDAESAVRAALAGLARLQAAAVGPDGNAARKSLETVGMAFVTAPRLDQHHAFLEREAEALQGPASLWADAALLGLSSRGGGAPEARAAATAALDAGWQSDPRRRVQILGAADAIRHRAWAPRILAALDDPAADVRGAAAAAVKTLGLVRVTDGTPKLAAVAPGDALAAVLAAAGDKATGEAVFARATCGTCHTVRQDQPQKGPYLGTIARTYKRRELAEAILTPDKSIAQGFASEVFVMADGTLHQGYVIVQAADEVRIRTGTGQEMVLDAAAIDERHKLPKSLMPTGLMGTFTLREFASLLDYLEALSQTP